MRDIRDGVLNYTIEHDPCLFLKDWIARDSVEDKVGFNRFGSENALFSYVYR